MRLKIHAIFLSLGLVLPTLFLIGCSNFRHKLDPSINYQKDLDFKVQYWNGERWSKWHEFNGMAVIKTATKYKIKIYPKGKTDMLALTSCHRQKKIAKPKTGWFSDGHEFEFEPVPNIETGRACSYSGGLYEAKRGRHGWMSIVIDSPREKLPAKVKCNGEVKQYGGASVCQAKHGLIQSIHFDRPVVVTKTVGCIIKEPADKMNWQYLMPEGECVLFFFDAKDERMSHKAILFGYDTIPIRGIN